MLSAASWRLSRCVRPVAPLPSELYRTFACSSISCSPPTTSSHPSPAIYISDSTDPFFNLAFEEWIFRKTDPEKVVLYMYRNRPSVIIGRNQNPWKEINITKLGELEIPFVRRKSGGGTVYHDLGNTNYCIFVPRQQFERRPNAELVSRALNKLQIPAFVNERNDICVDAFKMSSQKLAHERAYHHGTMLIDAKLGHLKEVLGNTKDSMITKGVASVSSPVKNLRNWSGTVGHASFVSAVVEEFKKTYGSTRPSITTVDDSELDKNEYVSTVLEELKSWEWMYGQTPEFTYDMTGEFPFGKLTCSISSRHGLITSSRIVEQTAGNAGWRKAIANMVESMVGDRYGSLEDTTRLVGDGKGTDKEGLDKVLKWFKTSM